jgi:hypothetical protein
VTSVHMRSRKKKIKEKKKIPVHSFYSLQCLHPRHPDAVLHSALATAAFTHRSLKPHPAYDALAPPSHVALHLALRCAARPTSSLTPRRHCPAGRLRWVRAVSGDEGAAAAHGVGDGLGDGAPRRAPLGGGPPRPPARLGLLGLLLFRRCHFNPH